MISSANKKGAAAALLAVLGVAYPFVVYMSLGKVPAGALVLLALALAGARIGTVKGSAAARPLLPPLAAVTLLTAALGVIQADLAAKAYPVLMSLGFAAAFGLSLRGPASLVEIFAAVRHPDPPPQARRYMRRVTVVWFVFLLANAATSLATVLWGSDRLWLLYNGLLSYVLMGTLFAGEWLVRRRVQAGLTAP